MSHTVNIRPRMSPVDPHEHTPCVEHRGRLFFWCLIGAMIWLALTLVLCYAAQAQYGGAAGQGNFYMHGSTGASGPVVQDEKDYGKAERINKETADWFSHLTRPYNDDGAEKGVASCCDAGDGYPIQIDEEAYPPVVGKEKNGVAHITDWSAKQIVLPNGNVKYRPEITDPASRIIHFSGEMVSPLKDGNPTKTAWAFVQILDGKWNHTYCIVPLPPAF